MCGVTKNRTPGALGSIITTCIFTGRGEDSSRAMILTPTNGSLTLCVAAAVAGADVVAGAVVGGPAITAAHKIPAASAAQRGDLRPIGHARRSIGLIGPIGPITRRRRLLLFRYPTYRPLVRLLDGRDGGVGELELVFGQALVDDVAARWASVLWLPAMNAESICGLNSSGRQ